MVEKRQALGRNLKELLPELPFSIRPALNGAGNVLCLEQEPSRGAMFTTRGLGRFVQYLDKVTSPTIIDLGPGVGSNVAFFGECLGGKLIVEDLFTEFEHAAGHIDPETTVFHLALSAPLS